MDPSDESPLLGVLNERALAATWRRQIVTFRVLTDFRADILRSTLKAERGSGQLRGAETAPSDICTKEGEAVGGCHARTLARTHAAPSPKRTP